MINRTFPVLLILLLIFISGCTEKQADNPENQTDVSKNDTITYKTYGAFTLPEISCRINRERHQQVGSYGHYGVVLVVT